MDNREKDGYLKTIKEARDADDAPDAYKKRAREAEFAYENLAAATSMGMYGMEETLTEFIELELSRQLLNRFNLENQSTPLSGNSGIMQEDN